MTRSDRFLPRFLRTLSIGILPAVLLCSGMQACAGFFYADEVQTSWELSAGYRVPKTGAVYFLTSYTLYHRPKGLARFPDGGQPKYVFSRTRLYRMTGKPPRLKKLWEAPNAAGNQATMTKFHPDGGVLKVAYPASNKLGDPSVRYRVLSIELKEDRVTELTGAEKKAAFEAMPPSPAVRKTPRYIRISELTRMTDGIPFAEWGLPSPLQYCDKDERGYITDIVELRGDRSYRKAIIERYGPGWTPEKVREILRRMDARQIKLSKQFKGMGYRIHSEKTREALKALLPGERSRSKNEQHKGD